MAEDTVIDVQGLWKRYGLPPYLRQIWHFITGRSQVAPGASSDTWALKDITLSVRRGEAIGIIGRNGAGKSTLLKVLAGVTPATHGKVTINGRIFPMIELNAGIHPDLTGRENVRLLAAVMGLARGEIEDKMPAIEEFCELGEWFERPVRQYSSGMLARLGFSVAMNIDADILLVDEVLAVGDLAFQRRCYERLETMRRNNIAFLLVTHSLNQIERLCERAIILERGALIAEGPPAKMAIEYMSRVSSSPTTTTRNQPFKPCTSGELEITDVRLSSPDGEIRPNTFRPRCRMRIEIDFIAREPATTVWHTSILSASYTPIWASEIFRLDMLQSEKACRLFCEITDLRLRPGDYVVSIKVRAPDGHLIQQLGEGARFQVRTPDDENPLVTSTSVYLDHAWVSA